MVMTFTYTEERGRAICDLLSEGESLERICRMDDMPDATTVRRWLRAFPDFKRDYDVARETQADTFVDQVVDIADGVDVRRDRHDKNIPEVQARADFVDFNNMRDYGRDHSLERDRLRIDARLRVAGKLRPKKYGATQQVEINETRNITQTKITRIELVAPQMEQKALPVIEAKPTHVDAED